MLRFILRRLIQMAGVVLVLSVLVFVWLIKSRTASAWSCVAQKTNVFSRWLIWPMKISTRLRSRAAISMILLKSLST